MPTRKWGGSLEAAVTLYAEPELAAKLTALLGDELRFVLLTSGATVADYNGRTCRCHCSRAKYSKG
ncbi:hypothetical protein MJ389_04325 [Escherichia coli]|nr:hypothetical protein MJ389_04325 [Escherichia coli]